VCAARPPRTRPGREGQTSNLASLVRGLSCAAVLTGCAPTAGVPPETPAPDDEVSVGYGTQSRRTVTGAITSITPTEADAHSARVEEMLSRVPGLQVQRRANGEYTLRIRGARSFRADEEPLLVIDDTPVPRGAVGSALAGLAPTDVARIDVLKDAASTSIYGIRGANGVIIITTKRSR
jgi:TonB-dependent starch-binding outer membrane protein SusC